MNVAGVSGPKACQVKAWAGASLTSGGPGNPFHEILQGLKGRNTIRAGHVPPLQGKEICWGTFTWGFTPGCHRTGFQPSEQRRIVAELDALQAVRGYIRNQANHHKQEDFQMEYRRFCEKNEKPLDERYAWD